MTHREENETLALASLRGLFHGERALADQRVSDQPMNNRLKPLDKTPTTKRSTTYRSETNGCNMRLG